MESADLFVEKRKIIAKTPFEINMFLRLKCEKQQLLP